tara:strand:+ start:2732 stop:3010 length:279 start_codon:yes stop_codon:yes gene_type:complete
MTNITSETAKQIIHDTNGKIFSVSFTKKDGSHRDMTARLGVTKHLTGKGRVYNPDDYNMLCVFDTHKEGYRTIPFERLLEVRFKGKKYNVVS